MDSLPVESYNNRQVIIRIKKKSGICVEDLILAIVVKI
jgi:hypothetical protein